MKFYRQLFILILLLSCFGTTAQVNPGASCATAGCSQSGSYQNLTGVGSMGSYSCLFSTPNPNWLAIGIANTGSIHLVLTQTTASGSMIDVDFALYGPYTSVAAGCPLINGSTPTVDCSYSGSATEYIDIPNAISGQVYILLVTNFNGSPGTISIGANAGQPSTGTLNCSINSSVTTSSTPATCNQANGTVTANPSGGFAPYTFSWNIPGNPTTQTVNNVPPGVYMVTVQSSPNPSTGQTVAPSTASVTVGNINATYSATSTPASCANGNNGTATANFTINNPAGITATYSWNDPNNQTTQTATGLLPGTYICTITLSNGCTGTATTTVGANTVNYSGTTTIVNCPGGANGTATATMTPVVGTLSYVWNDVNAQITQTATNLTAGNYTCTVTSSIGCVGTVNVVVSEIPGMVPTIANQSDVTCNSGNDGVVTLNVTAGTAPYTYSWDNSASLTNTANDLVVGNHVITITDANGCVTSITATLNEPAPLSISVLTPDQEICPEGTADLSVTGTGGSSPYTFTWRENGVVIGTGPSITVDPLNSGTVYCVELTEQCGSPSTDSCLTVTFPTPVNPDYRADKPYSCLPGILTFQNFSSNKAEIAQVKIDYGNGNVETVPGSGDINYTYTFPGIFDVSVVVTSIQGCITDSVFIGEANIIPNPVADFNMSSNPTTFFETAIVMQDKSSPSVISWEWDSPGSTPTSSQFESPTFQFPEGIVANYTITLMVETPEGCRDTISKILTVNSDIIFYAPNTFTPDGDEFNQSWKFHVSGIDPYNFELLIMNRWGEVIWETRDPEVAWDGTYNGQLVPNGSYTWVARVKDIYNDSKRTFNGSINVMR